MPWLNSLYLFNPNTEINTVYRKSAKKYRDMNFSSYRPALDTIIVFIKIFIIIYFPIML